MRRSQQGFTLIEMVVAIAIFALVSSMAYGGLSNIVTARDITNAQAQRLSQLQRAFAMLQRDVEQAIDRGIRDSYGDTVAPFILGEDEILTFTRTGYPNPANFLRSHLMRVRYEVREGKLVRTMWTVIDQPYEAENREAEIVDEVVGLKTRVLTSTGSWQTEWPPRALGQEKPPALPVAVEITLNLEDYGEIKRLFRLVAQPEVASE